MLQNSTEIADLINTKDAACNDLTAMILGLTDEQCEMVNERFLQALAQLQPGAF